MSSKSGTTFRKDESNYAYLLLRAVPQRMGWHITQEFLWLCHIIANNFSLLRKRNCLQSLYKLRTCFTLFISLVIIEVIHVNRCRLWWPLSMYFEILQKIAHHETPWTIVQNPRGSATIVNFSCDNCKVNWEFFVYSKAFKALIGRLCTLQSTLTNQISASQFHSKHSRSHYFLCDICDKTAVVLCEKYEFLCLIIMSRWFYLIDRFRDLTPKLIGLWSI